MEHLAGDTNTIVRLKEQGCVFEFEYQDVFWNSRLHMEHSRLIDALFLNPVVDSQIFHQQPIIADATCGVGPFSIPLVKHGDRVICHANDLNPTAVQWLRRSAKLNGLCCVEVDNVHTFAEAQDADVGTMLVSHAPGDAG